MQRQWVTIKAIIQDAEGRVLLIREIKDGKVRWWELPGGRMDVGEEPFDTLRRELQEEIGVDMDVHNGELIHVEHWGLRGDALNNPIVGIFYYLKITEPLEISFRSNHDKVVWVHPLHDEFPEPLSEVTRRTCEAVCRKLYPEE